jgi:hypothetical protein
MVNSPHTKFLTLPSMGIHFSAMDTQIGPIDTQFLAIDM